MVGCFVPDHLDPHQLTRNHYSMDSIGKKVFDALQPRQTLAIDIDKTHVVSEQFDRPARFLAAQLPPIRALLVDNLKSRPAEDPDFSYLPSRFCRQRKSASRDRRESTLLDSHTLLLFLVNSACFEEPVGLKLRGSSREYNR